MKPWSATLRASTCFPTLRGDARTLRYYSWYHERRRYSGHSLKFNASWIAGCKRQSYQIAQSCVFSLTGNSPCTHVISSRHLSTDASSSNERLSSDDTGENSEQADEQSNFVFTYLPIGDVERLENYRKGGYHPIAIGDTLKDGRYEVVDKLGHGGYSTIWIAKDKDAADTYAAVKVCISDKTITSQEKEIIQKLLDSSDDRASMILPILDDFVHDGPNGQHPCIVTPPARMSLASAKSATDGYNIFPLPVARSIVAQLVQVVAFCHAQGVVHGDLHTGNVLLRFARGDDIHTLSRSAFYERFGEPWQVPVERVDGGDVLDPGVPTHGVAAAWLGCHPQELTLAESAIFLADFGESYVAAGPGAETRTYCHAPPRVTPPEAHFATGELGFPADVWALACVIWEVYSGSGWLFGTPFQDDDRLRRDWVHVLGRPPDEWWDAWDGDYRHNLFTEDGVIRDDRRDYFINCDPGLEGRFELMVQEPRREEGMQEVLDEEKTALLEMLRAMLANQPADRIEAQDILGTEWMLRWGLPALDDLKETRHV